jgi:hypothetical protein
LITPFGAALRSGGAARALPLRLLGAAETFDARLDRFLANHLSRCRTIDVKTQRAAAPRSGLGLRRLRAHEHQRQFRQPERYANTIALIATRWSPDAFASNPSA